MPSAGPHGTLAARLLLRVVAFCRARGHDPVALCRSAALDLEALQAPEARVPYASAIRLGEQALALTNDPEFGLHLAEDVRDAQGFDAGVLLLMASPTVRAAFDQMLKNQRYWGDGDRSRLVPLRDGVAVRYLLPGTTGEYARHAHECALAEVLIGVRTLTGERLSPRVVRFRHARPASTRAHEQLFDCPLEFGAAHDEIVFDDAALDTPMKHANEAFFAVFSRQVEQALARLPKSASASANVRAAVHAALVGGHCTLATTARALATTPRTLQRRLEDEGTSFGEVVDALRRELATSYLDHGLPLAEVASRLGYADTTAFHRAFRRWTGSSPRKGTSPTPDATES
ncbi:MAG: AraC family transcriptional regulator [Myxococcales bacterium]|nr:AraC family transcriptional regulator [Myxococcales bacterium]